LHGWHLPLSEVVETYQANLLAFRRQHERLRLMPHGISRSRIVHLRDLPRLFRAARALLKKARRH
jgi:hypothetical protein